MLDPADPAPLIYRHRLVRLRCSAQQPVIRIQRHCELAICSTESRDEYEHDLGLPSCDGQRVHDLRFGL